MLKIKECHRYLKVGRNSGDIIWWKKKTRRDFKRKFIGIWNGRGRCHNLEAIKTETGSVYSILTLLLVLIKQLVLYCQQESLAPHQKLFTISLIS